MKPASLIKKRASKAARDQRDHLNGSGDGPRERIEETAYKLYERRGREDGQDLDDWLKAEALVQGELRRPT